MLPSRPGQAATTPEATPRKLRRFSAATRRTMKDAQQRRWAKIRGESAPPSQARPEPPKAKRRLSAAGRKAIQEAERKRWAKKSAEAAPARMKGVVKNAAPARAAKKSAPVKKAAVKKATAKKTAAAPAPDVVEPAAQ